ncbi:MAG: hypothetical protein KDA98_12000 [Acidimicrobiales bacterium]|nr:hypothetical protein [Acidimicrobiales bacterium]
MATEPTVPPDADGAAQHPSSPGAGDQPSGEDRPTASDVRDATLVELASLGRPNVEIGPAVDRSSKWVQRRLKDPDIARRVSESRAARLDEAVGRLGELVLDAIDTMRSELSADRSADRLRAASMIVSSLVRVREQAQLDQLIGELRSEIDELRDIVKGA